MKIESIFVILLFAIILSCTENVQEDNTSQVTDSMDNFYGELYKRDSLNPLLNKYTPFTLTTDISALSESEKQLIRKLIEAGQIIDDMFWYEAYGNKEELLSSIEDEDLKTFARINYGPYDRLDGN